MKKAQLYLLLVLLAFPCAAQRGYTVVGAKHFNESYILAEIISQLLENEGEKVERKFNLGGTAIIYKAVLTREIDVYPEYSGTISNEILNLENENETDNALRKQGLEKSAPYGFSNTYALLVSKELSIKYNLNTISDLGKYPELRFGFSNEFLKRKDGWENLKAAYGLTQDAIGLEHGLAYSAIVEKSIDVTDAYSTDGEIKKYNMVVLADDKHFFPEYNAVSLYHLKAGGRLRTVLPKLTGLISAEEMQAMNAEALLGEKSHAQIANEFLVKKGLLKNKREDYRYSYTDVLKKTWTHLKLTLLSLVLAVLIGLPLGMGLRNFGVLTKVVVYVAGILQTIPSIALLALMIPLLGIGTVPAVVALCLYALLPVLRSTITGLRTVDGQLKKVATAIGLNTRQKLWMVEMPLAMPVILTGIRTAAVISVGTATLAAFIGAGGLGEFIVTGLALNNTSLILMGAIPAAVLAIIIELFFEWIEVLVVPAHLRKKNVN